MPHYWYYAIKAERIKKKMEQATKAFNERDKCSQNLAQYDQYYAEYEQHDKKLNQQLVMIKDALVKQKKDMGLYEYPSTPSLVSHLGECLDSKPRAYFERTKREVWHKNTIAKWVYQHKLENVTTSDDEREINCEYERFKKKHSQILSICEKRIQDLEDEDYVMLEDSMSSLHLESLKGSQKEEPEITREYVKLIGGDTIPPQYSKEISRYQPSDSERTKAMEDALNAVREFTHEPNIAQNGNINSCTMKEMWDYENGIMGPGKRKRDSNSIQQESIGPQVPQSRDCGLCGGSHQTTECPHESRFSQLGEDPSTN